MLKPGDTKSLSEVLRLFEDVFEMKGFRHPDLEHLRDILSSDMLRVIVARQYEQIVGAMTVYVLPNLYETRPLAYIMDLAVDRDFQRKGIGTQLMEYIRKVAGQEGFSEVFVQADRPDDYALDFYRKTNPSAEEDVVHFYYSL